MTKSKIAFSLQQRRIGNKREKVKKIASYLDSPVHKLYRRIAIETGLRASEILALKYKDVQDDYESGIVPVAVRVERPNRTGKKSARVTFLGERSARLLKECIEKGLVQASPGSPLFPSRNS